MDGASEIAILAVGAAATGLWGNRQRHTTGASMVLPWAKSTLSATTAGADPGVGLARLFGSFLKIGALLFGWLVGCPGRRRR